MEWAIAALAASLVATALFLCPVLTAYWDRNTVQETRKLLEEIAHNDELVRQLKEVDECPWCGCRLSMSPTHEVEGG